MLLIGSRAARHYLPEARMNHDSDWDFLVSPDEAGAFVERVGYKILSYRLTPDKFKALIVMNDGVKLELELMNKDSSSEYFVRANERKCMVSSMYGYPFNVARPSTLALIKLSHLRVPIKWRKNIEDYHFLRERMETPSEDEVAGYNKRWMETHDRYKVRKTNLNMSNDEFFAKSAGAVKRIYHHDDLHAVTCHGPKPLFLSLKNDLNSALLSRTKFDALCYQEKIQLVREEAYAIALERVIIPASIKGEKSPTAKDAFLYAIQRICTNLTDGWFRELAIECYPDIINFNYDYVNEFLTAVQKGQIRRISNGEETKGSTDSDGTRTERHVEA